MISKKRDVCLKLPFVPGDTAYLVYPESSVNPVPWDELGESLLAPFIEGKVFKAAILECIAIALETLSKISEDGHKGEVRLQSLIDMFPSIDVRRFNVDNWEQLVVKRLPNVAEANRGMVAIKERKNLTRGNPTRRDKLRIEVILDGEALCIFNDMGLSGPRSSPLNFVGLERLIISRLRGEVVSRKFIMCKAEADDRENRLLEKSVEDAGFGLTVFPVGKRKTAQTYLWWQLRKARDNPDVDAIALLSVNDNLAWRVQDLEAVGKPVVLLTQKGGKQPRLEASPFLRAPSQVIGLDNLAKKIHARTKIENEVFPYENGE